MIRIPVHFDRLEKTQKSPVKIEVNAIKSMVTGIQEKNRYLP